MIKVTGDAMRKNVLASLASLSAKAHGLIMELRPLDYGTEEPDA